MVLSINTDQSVLVRFPSRPPLSQSAHPPSRHHPIHHYCTRFLLSILEKAALSFLDSCQSSISKDQVRAGLAGCAPAGLCPQWEPLTGTEDTRVARDTNAFRWSWPHKGTASQHANAKFLVCLFGVSSTLRYEWGLENLSHTGFQDLWVWTKENSHSGPSAKKRKILRHSFFGRKHKGVCLNKAPHSFLWHVWIFIMLGR